VGACLSAHWLELRFNSARRTQMMTRARLAAGSVPPEHLSELSWSAADLHRPSYQKIKGLMTSLVRSDRDLRFVLLAGLRGGKCYFVADSEAPDSVDYSPPGQVYEEASPEYVAGMSSRKPFLLGPVKDRWGTWIIASVPVLGPDGDHGINAELDIAAADWESAEAAARLPAFLVGLSFLLVSLTSFRAQDSIQHSLQRMRLSEKQKTTIIESSPDAVLLVGPDRRYISANRHALEFMRVDASNLQDTLFEDAWPFSNREQLRQAALQTLDGEAVELEIEYQLDGQEPVGWRVATNPIRNPSGVAIGFVAICCDITERKLTERSLREAKEAAEKASRAKSDFLAVISHEIRTPLGAVIGMLELLRSTPDAAQRKRYTELARQSADSLLHLLDDILDAAKVESGKLSLEETAFRPRAELSRVLEGMKVRAEAKGLRLEWQFSESLPVGALGDPTRLKQILANLVSNAIKFTSSGSVTVDVQTEALQEERFTLCIVVSDTGIGMTSEVLQRLFNNFEQADASTTRRFGGTGLGLSIAKGLVDRMGGNITVQSSPGRGASFRVTVPLRITAASAALQDSWDESRPPIPVTRAALNLLCAEDDLVSSEYLREILGRMGHRATFVENGRQAVEKAAARAYDAILMDNRMPEMDGFQATRAIRSGAAGERAKAIYIIAVTANASGTYRDECLSSGMNDYLTKPVNPADLHAALSRVVGSPPSNDPFPSANLDELLESVGRQSESAPLSLPPPSHAIIQAYLAEAPRHLASMRESLRNRDYQRLARAAHSLKGNSRYVAANDIADLGAKLQTCAEAEQHELLDQMLNTVDAAFARVKPMLENSLSSQERT
jgi:PAS domain S-box-containing protein